MRKETQHNEFKIPCMSRQAPHGFQRCQGASEAIDLIVLICDFGVVTEIQVDLDLLDLLASLFQIPRPTTVDCRG